MKSNLFRGSDFMVVRCPECHKESTHVAPLMKPKFDAINVFGFGLTFSCISEMFGVSSDGAMVFALIGASVGAVAEVLHWRYCVAQWRERLQRSDTF